MAPHTPARDRRVRRWPEQKRARDGIHRTLTRPNQSRARSTGGGRSVTIDAGAAPFEDALGDVRVAGAQCDPTQQSGLAHILRVSGVASRTADAHGGFVIRRHALPVPLAFYRIQKAPSRMAARAFDGTASLRALVQQPESDEQPAGTRFSVVFCRVRIGNTTQLASPGSPRAHFWKMGRVWPTLV